MSIKKVSVRMMTQTAMLTAVLAVTAQIAIPLPSGIPVTMQVFGVVLCAVIGGMKTGFPALLVYLCAGAAGMPVFAGFRGGFAVFLEQTGGFLWGFILLSLCCAWSSGRRKLLAVPVGIMGLLLCHLCGCLQYATYAGLSLPESFLLISLPYLPKDLLSLAAAYWVSVPIRKALRKNEQLS